MGHCDGNQDISVVFTSVVLLGGGGLNQVWKAADKPQLKYLKMEVVIFFVPKIWVNKCI